MLDLLPVHSFFCPFPFSFFLFISISIKTVYCWQIPSDILLSQNAFHTVYGSLEGTESGHWSHQTKVDGSCGVRIRRSVNLSALPESEAELVFLYEWCADNLTRYSKPFVFFRDLVAISITTQYGIPQIRGYCVHFLLSIIRSVHRYWNVVRKNMKSWIQHLWIPCSHKVWRVMKSE